jgi:cyclopropane-fatty-acyl-phospholipid synthase
MTIQTSSSHLSLLRHRAIPSFRGEIGIWMLKKFLTKIIRKGALKLVTSNGSSFQFGHGAPTITLRIVAPEAAMRIMLNPDMALGEAYADGAIVIDKGDIHDLLELCLENLGWDDGHWIRAARGAVSRLFWRFNQHNPVSVARRNVAHHYDLSSDLYDLFLDADRQYSCAYFLSPDDTLEQAQQQKMRHLAAKLLLCPGQRVLDIGSGWGGLALDLARVANVDVTGVTLSTEQQIFAERRAGEMGRQDDVRFLLKDYRHVKEKYDRIVSVGMFEHVGLPHYREYFEKVRDLLEDDGVAVIHTIGRADNGGTANSWINKYIFPGGFIPALSEMTTAIEQAGLYITDVEILRLHYAETLKEWRRRFNANRARVAKIYDERFCRIWEFYLSISEASFRHGGLVNFQIQLSKTVSAVPLSRDYIGAWEARDTFAKRRSGLVADAHISPAIEGAPA